MTEAIEARSSTTTTTILETKNGDALSSTVRVSKRTVTDDLYSTFSSPMAWVLVLALIITWSAVAIIMFDLLDNKSLKAHTLYCDDPCLPPGPRAPAARKAHKAASSLRAHTGAIPEMTSDPVKAMNEAMEESTDWIGTFLGAVTSLIAPEELDEASHIEDL